MLVNFKVKNYKSYKKETLFSMLKAPRIRDLSYSLLKQKIKNKQFDVLCSSVLYGPNASGKSNILDAMNTLKSIVLQGHIKNTQAIGKATAQSNLELIPFIFTESEPINFNIEFITNNIHYCYDLAIDIGGFLSSLNKREVVYESLSINYKKVFERKLNEIVLLDVIKEFKDDFIDDLDTDKLIQMFNETLVEDSIFLTNGFKNISKRFSQEIIKWFESKLVIIPRLEGTFSLPIFEDKKVYIDNFVNNIAKQSGISGSDIAYIKDESSRTQTVSLIKKDLESDKGIFIPVNVIESYGTERIIQLMPIIFNVLQSGSVLAVDELDVALHPMLMMNIISIFHNDEININKAQLIFNTHNPIYLNNAIFRRDEIKFVEKELDSHESILYSLSDFGTKGENGVRNTTDYIKNYFMNKYGAIVNIDYSDIFKQAMKVTKNEKNK